MDSVLIVGCGVFGLSTALALAKQGYSVTAIDAYAPPSPWSAACDYNKIVRGEYLDERYTKLSIEAIEMWSSDEKFKGIYNECGRILVTPEDFKARETFERVGIANLQKFGKALDVEYLTGADQVAERFEFLKFNGLKTDEKIKFNPYGGLSHSSNALVAVYQDCKKNGVKFIFGEDGEAFKIEKGSDGKAIIYAKSGKQHKADKVLVALGANTGSLIDMGNQQSATGLFVTCIKLSDEEYLQYKDCPILFDVKMGYFFPPDPETKLMKVALPGSGACNRVENPNGDGTIISLPRFKNEHPEDTIPISGEREVRLFLAKYVPQLAYHKLVGSKMCWIGDTETSNFIIDYVPKFENLLVASGDSGHAFKFLPNIGRYIVQRMQDKLDDELTELWSWKNTSSGFDPGNCEWRVASDYKDVSEIDFYKERRDGLESKL